MTAVEQNCARLGSKKFAEDYESLRFLSEGVEDGNICVKAARVDLVCAHIHLV